MEEKQALEPGQSHQNRSYICHMNPILVMLNSFQHLLPKAILTQILEILKEILKQVQDDKAVQDDIVLILMRLP